MHTLLSGDMLTCCALCTATALAAWMAAMCASLQSRFK